MQQLGRLFVELTRQTGMNFLLQQAKRHGEAVQRGGWRRRAARNIDVDRYDFIGTAPDAVQVVEDAAAVAAGAVGDTDLRIRRRLPGAQRRGAHRASHCPGKQQNIGMARRRHHLNPEAFSVEQRRKGGENFDFAAVAAATVDAVDVGRTFNLLQ